MGVKIQTISSKNKKTSGKSISEVFIMLCLSIIYAVASTADNLPIFSIRSAILFE